MSLLDLYRVVRRRWLLILSVMLVGGLIAIAIVTGVLGVLQTWLSNVVGQRVMHDLRAAVYRHLQRLSLAFFTRTRTGEVQSRITNDIGGMQTVVTSTATSLASNLTTVVAPLVAVLLLPACRNGAAEESGGYEPASVEPIEGTEFSRVTLTADGARRASRRPASLPASCPWCTGTA
jgi:ABC-type multidrug transport system fused ATPase/permease subunit